MPQNQTNRYYAISVKCIIILFWLTCGAVIFYISSNRSSKKNDLSLNILAWPQIIDGDFLVDFEKQTGIQVNISYFESNEELLTKLRATKKHGYDLIMPSDYMLKTFINEQHIKEIDKTKLHFWHDLQPTLVGNKSDPLNLFSVPCFWTVFGIGVNLDYFNNQLPEDQSWHFLFSEQQEYRPIGMMENIVQLFSIAAFYVSKKSNFLTYDATFSKESLINTTLQMLIKQKNHRRVVAYTESRIEYMLAAGECAACFCSSADIAKMVSSFKHISFIIPKEGTFASLDSFAITTQTTKDELVYAFLNYVYQPSVMKKYVEKFQFPSPIVSCQSNNPPAGITFDIYKTIPIHSFQQWLSAAEIEYIWLSLRTA